MTRTLLFLDYWSLNEPLTQATVIPTLHMVLERGMADRVVLVTVERSGSPMMPPSGLRAGIVHVPLFANRFWPRPLARAADLWRMAPRVARIARSHQAGFIMARGVVAGGIAHKVHLRTGTPYAVDYFEPHADYMVDVGEWRRGGLLERGLKRLIAEQSRTARYRIAVSHNYRRQLMEAGADGEGILVAPCPVDMDRMRFDPAARNALRAELGWNDAVVGVYAGKFGGLYHREHAFRAFAGAQRFIGERYAQIVLTTAPKEEVLGGLRAAGFAGDRVLVRFAPHDQVAKHLSAADFAFAPYRGTPSSACLSPMKIGEYWAAGLPVILTRGVGDDSAIIDADPMAGALFDPLGDDLGRALERVMGAIASPGQRSATGAFAARHRSMDLTRAAYERVFSGAWTASDRAARP